MKMQPDEFIFWATLEEHLYVSTPRYSRVLYCFQTKDLCFGSTVFDADFFQKTMSGQWRIEDGGQLIFLKRFSESEFPSPSEPLWLREYNKNGGSSETHVVQ